MENGRPATAEPQLELSELSANDEYRVASDQLDPRDWVIRTQDGRTVGRISDLIIDETALAARYLVCDLELEQRHVLIPTGFARLDESTQTVFLDFITGEDLARLPGYKGLPLSLEQQLELETALTMREPATPEPIIQRRSEHTT